MSREILFKAKCTTTGEWVEGDLLREKDYLGNILTRIYQIKGDGICEKHNVDPETVCQYTGWTDTNSRKIFDGDRIKVDDLWTGIVVWDFNDTSFNVEPDDDDVVEQLGVVVNGNIVEVIGNIFDNPELLEGQVNNE